MARANTPRIPRNAHAVGSAVMTADMIASMAARTTTPRTSDWSTSAIGTVWPRIVNQTTPPAVSTVAPTHATPRPAARRVQMSRVREIGSVSV